MEAAARNRPPLEHWRLSLSPAFLLCRIQLPLSLVDLKSLPVCTAALSKYFTSSHSFQFTFKLLV
jgi:hypothetical protein